MINIVVLCAGKGQRFKNAGYKDSKPFIQVRGKTILEHMTESTGLILHDFGRQRGHINLWFAMRESDRRYEDFLYYKYGKNINIAWFTEDSEALTGNLMTAYHTISKFHKGNDTQRLLVLDCDNKFHVGSTVISNFNFLRPFVFCLPPDPSEYHWANIICDENGKVENVVEKNSDYSHLYRAVGVFGFPRISVFMEAAKKVIDDEEKTKNEYYISSVYKYLNPRAVPLIIEDNFYVSLGTPEELDRFILL